MRTLHHRRAGALIILMRVAIIVTIIPLLATIFSCAEPLQAPRPASNAKPLLFSASAQSQITGINTEPVSNPVLNQVLTSSLEPIPVTMSTRDSSPIATPAFSMLKPVIKDLSNVYIGSIHSGHTNCSDGMLEYPEEFYATFKQLWGWIATTDHDKSLDPSEWQKMVENASAYDSEDFVSLFGYEWTSSMWGHLSVVFQGDQISKNFDRVKSAIAGNDNPRNLYSLLDPADGLAVFAHPALSGLFIDFNRESDYRDDSIACLAGILGINNTTHWNATWDYADGSTIAATGTDNAYQGSWIKTALDRGYHLGFVGELDLHQKTIDPLSYRYTGVVARSLTREGIFEALKKRHTYAVTSPSGVGKKILVRADAGDYLMGDAFTNESSIIKVTLQGKTDLDQFTLINLFVNGSITQSRVVSGRDLFEDFIFTLPDGDSYTFFEVRALSSDGQMSQAFTSPMFVTVAKSSYQSIEY